ncbi:hypothetical protein SAMN05660473_02862 [Arthrobacter sp. 49Tsu3.1M3]|uniref:hypothetical protein n=1 Tax=Arthrobacter sp. 49Tsu3.1M3 TaxID=1279029 RepID=UPI0009A8A54E|nr:hypothetical protein [Arthrobacter sp. 49Tsu3.1M3]SKB88682.1 hypothetical protein SAMN05660473_02862 [Arthrobacter sp. 49Tsu3.1M3]
MNDQPPHDPVLSALAVTLAVCVDEYGYRRVPLTVLRERAYVVHPELYGDLQARARLRDSIDELAVAGTVQLPAANSKTGWDDSMSPRLPAWVSKVVRPPESGARGPKRKIYPDWLEPAAAVATRDDEFELLNRVADWRRDHVDLLIVPIEERSLEMFGDEKALGRRSGSRLFTSGALSLEMLGCHRTPLPLPSRHIPGNLPTRLLVCENSAAYYSMIKAAQGLSPEVRPDLHVAFGGGNQFSVGHGEIAFLDPVPVRVLYCGDLDRAGIQIAARAAESIAGDLPLEPAVPHYEWMLEHGIRQPDGSSQETVDHALAWFPVELRPRVRELLATGMRISQETVGLRALTQHPELIQRM